MLHRAGLFQRMLFAPLAVIICMLAGCVGVPRQPEIPEELLAHVLTPLGTYTKLKKFLGQGKYREAYALFTVEYLDEYAPDLETFKRRAAHDKDKIVAGPMLEDPHFAGNTAWAVIGYGDEFRKIYFLFDEKARGWLITSEAHYRFLTEKGDQSSPLAALRSFLRFLIGGWPERAHKMLASEYVFARGINMEMFMRRTAPLFRYLFSPGKRGRTWKARTGPHGENWAVLLIDFPGAPAPRPICFVKKLDRWYLAIDPIGDAAAAIGFFEKLKKEHEKRKKERAGKEAEGD